MHDVVASRAVVKSPQGKFALCNKTKHDCEMRVRNMHFRAGPDAVVDFAWTDAGFLFGHVMQGTIMSTLMGIGMFALNLIFLELAAMEAI